MIKDQNLPPVKAREKRFVDLVKNHCKGLHFSLKEQGLGVNCAHVLAEILEKNRNYSVLGNQ